MKEGFDSPRRYHLPFLTANIRGLMIVTTGFDVQGRSVAEYLGVVRGIVVRATGIGRGFIGGLKSIAGGNIEEFSEVCEAARMEAFNRMVLHAH